VAAATGTLLKKHKDARWRVQAQALLAACEVVDLGDISHPAQETRVWLTEYLGKSTVMPDIESALITKSPFTQAEETLIFLEDFRHWVEYEQGIKLTGIQLGHRLRQSECEPKKVNVVLPKGRTSRQCWSLNHLTE